MSSLWYPDFSGYIMCEEVASPTTNIPEVGELYDPSEWYLLAGSHEVVAMLQLCSLTDMSLYLSEASGWLKYWLLM